MTILYKLTDQNMQTHFGFQWALGKQETASGEGELCGPGFLHAYTDPLLAVLLNPIHADIVTPRLFKATGTVAKTDNGLKVGCTKLKLTKELELPVITMEQRIKFGILCAKEVCRNKAWNEWADNRLSGKDRSREAARAAARAAEAGAWAAEAAAEAAAWAEAARAGAWAAEAGAWAAARAAETAAWAAETAEHIDLIAIAREAVTR